MKILALFGFLLALHCASAEKNLVCFYDASSFLREGFAKMLTSDVDVALQFCTHLIYGYAGLKHDTHELYSRIVDLDVFHYNEITKLKSKYPNLKMFLSVGGDKDIDEEHPLKYLELLEAGLNGQQNFIDSSIAMLRHNGFDGLDLAFQFPRNKPRKVHGVLGRYWKKFKKLFTGDYIVDDRAEDHKQQFTELARNLKSSFARVNLGLSLTVLPNVNSTWYFDIPQIAQVFDFVNLAAFDFLTPERNPEEADYTAPIFALTDQDRLSHYNIEYQLNHWILNRFPSQKLNLGIASYGRAWVLTKDSGLTGMPVVPETEGPAPAGLQSNVSGLLSWPEICSKLPNGVNDNYRGANAPLQRVTDLEQRHGNYAFRPADEDDNFGMWVSYDDPDFAGVKTSYARGKGIGGIALFDLSYDDFRGLCTGQKYPILRSIKYNL